MMIDETVLACITTCTAASTASSPLRELAERASCMESHMERAGAGYAACILGSFAACSVIWMAYRPKGNKARAGASPHPSSSSIDVRHPHVGGKSLPPANAAWSWVHIHSCNHGDGFYSNMRFWLPQFASFLSLSKHTTRFVAAFPDLWYVLQADGLQHGNQGPVPFLKIYDEHHLRRRLRGAGVANAEAFYACGQDQPPLCRKRQSSGDCRTLPTLRQGCWRSSQWPDDVERLCSPANASFLAALLEEDASANARWNSSQLRPVHWLLSGFPTDSPDRPAVIDRMAHTARAFGDKPTTASSASFETANLLRAYDMLRPSAAIRAAVSYLLRSWALIGKPYVAFHLRRGATYAQAGPFREAIVRDYYSYVVEKRLDITELRKTSPRYAHVLQYKLAKAGAPGSPCSRNGTGCKMDWHSVDVTRLFQSSDAEMIAAVQLAIDLASPNGDCAPLGASNDSGYVQDVVLSTVSSASADAAEVLRRGLDGKVQVHTFGAELWQKIDAAHISNWDPSEQLMKDAVEVEVWLAASVFVGTGSTMSSMTMWRRHSQRGMSFDGRSQACNVDAQPCISLKDYFKREGNDRLQCRRR